MKWENVEEFERDIRALLAASTLTEDEAAGRLKVCIRLYEADCLMNAAEEGSAAFAAAWEEVASAHRALALNILGFAVV